MSPVEQSQLFTAITEDGSLSLVSGEHGELHHDLNGAYTEALCNFSQVALPVWMALNGSKLPDCLKVFNSCFGLGYNSFTLAQLLPPGVSLYVTAIEIDSHVLSFVPQILAQSCFADLRKDGIGDQEAQDLGQFKLTTITRRGNDSTLSFNLIQSCLRAYLAGSKNSFDDLFDLIMHDPFSPKTMPELWTIDLFAKYKERLKDGGMILTYSSAPAVRGALLDLGFYVYRTPALTGQWGGTLAVLGNHLESSVQQGKFGDKILPLDSEALIRLAKSSRLPYRDPTFVATREQIVAAREAEQKTFGSAAKDLKARV